MAKANPSRQELLEFINDATSELGIMAKKIEDLSSGVQYLHLLNQTHPDIVKMVKVNLKACQQYEFVNNLRFLSSCLAEAKAPFTLEAQVQKISQRNYQENLNLLRNLYKFHFHSKEIRGKDPISRKTSVSSDLKIELKNEAEKKKPIPKLIVKPPQKPITKIEPPKKYEADNSGFQGMLNDAKKHTEQIRRIMVVVQGEDKKDQKEIAAEEKLKKIMSILGLNPPNSNKKSKNEPQTRGRTNSSIICQPSKSSSKKSIDVESNGEKSENAAQKSELKSKLTTIDEKSEKAEGVKKVSKKFDCEEIQQNVSKRYQLRPQSNQKSARESRMSTRSLLRFDDDPRYDENLLSPEVDIKEEKRPDGSIQKSILIRSNYPNNNSIEKTQNKSLKKVHFESSQKQSEKKEMSIKKTEETPQITSAIKLSEKFQRSSRKKESQKLSAQKNIID